MNGARQPPLRTFIALWPDATVRAELARRAALVAKACSGRPSRPDTLHLTLVFIGSTPREKIPALTRLMDDTRAAPFTLRLDQSGWWRHNGVVWAGTRAAPPALTGLQHDLALGAEKLGFSLDVRPYVPHLTLARDGGRSPPANAMPALEWPVASFVLVASELSADGPRYRLLHQSALDADLPVAAGSG